MKKAPVLTIAAVLMGAFGAANAALPTAVTTALTNFQTDAQSMLDAGWPVLTAIFGGFVLMKLFKKVGNKAT